ncbi:hypothetical protein D7V86_21135, partial [bacterium D16-51]
MFLLGMPGRGKRGYFMERTITEQMLGDYVIYLREEEKSAATISKYLCDLRKLTGYAAGRALD